MAAGFMAGSAADLPGMCRCASRPERGREVEGVPIESAPRHAVPVAAGDLLRWPLAAQDGHTITRVRSILQGALAVLGADGETIADAERGVAELVGNGTGKAVWFAQTLPPKNTGSVAAQDEPLQDQHGGADDSRKQRPASPCLPPSRCP